MFFPTLLSLLACGNAPAPALPPSAQEAVQKKAEQVAEAATGGQVNDLSGIPVALTGAVTSAKAVPPAGGPKVTAAAVGDAVTITVTGAPICGAEGAAVTASRSAFMVEVAVAGGAPCAAGQVGEVVLGVTDRPGNERGREVRVTFAAGGAPLPQAEIAR